MKVLFLVPSFESRGPVNVVLELCTALSGFDDVQVDVAAFSTGDKRDEFLAASHSVFVLEGIYVARLVKLWRVLREGKYDVVHSHCLLPDVCGALLAGSAISVTTVHNYFDADYLLEYGRVKGALVSAVHKYVVRRMDCVVSCSESVQTHVAKAYRLASVVVPNGVSEGKADSRGWASGGRCEVRYVYVGMLNRRKNVEIVLQAFRSMESSGRKLTIVGNGPLLAEYRERYRQPNIEFLGQVRNPRAVMSECDVFLSASMAEGLPMALLEAMAEGLTYVISDIEPHLEVYKKGVSAGVIVSNTIDDFRSAISGLTRDEINVRSLEAQRVFNEHYSSGKMAGGYYSLYQSLTSGG